MACFSMACAYVVTLAGITGVSASPHPGTMGALMAQQASASDELEQTRYAVRTFLDAYARHDLRGTLAALSDTTLNYGDCDYAEHQSSGFRNKNSLRRWIRARFEEGDQFQQVDVTIGGTLADGTPDYRVAGVTVTRVNDPLEVQGDLKHRVSFKLVRERGGTRLSTAALSGYECMQGRFPRVPSIVHTRVLLQRFIDAYNGHDVHLALSTMTGSVAYRDRGYIAGRWLHGKTAVGTWLRARFADDDHLAEAVIRVGRGGNDRNPRVAEVRADRSSASLPHQGTASSLISLMFRLTPRGDHIAFVNALPVGPGGEAH